MPRPRVTVMPSYENRNGQVVVRKTSRRGTDHNAYVYMLRCKHCENEYGANGTDIWQRKCPKPVTQCKAGGGRAGI